MIKKYFLSTLLVAAAVMLSGCTTEYEKDDIESYVKEELALENYTVSDTAEESEDEEGYTDRIWTVIDEENDITFHVLDDYHWGAESMTNVLYDDYEGTVFLNYQDQLPENELVEDGRIIITAGPDTQGINTVSMEVWYKDRAELQRILDQLIEYRKFFQNLGFDSVSPGISIQYEGPDGYPCKGQMIGGNSWAQLNSDMDYVFKEAMEGYILTGLDYRVAEVFADTTEEERQEIILAEDTRRVGVVRNHEETDVAAEVSDAGTDQDGRSDAGTDQDETGDAGTDHVGTSDAGADQDGTSDAGTDHVETGDAGTNDAGTDYDKIEYYDDLIANSYGYGLSVSTLYEVLDREGFNPTGDALHFTCTGVDGTDYEFSCGFVSEDFDGKEGAYYLADGTPVQLGNAYNIHIRAAEISKLFGITIVTEVVTGTGSE